MTKYHVVRRGEIVARTKTLAKAEAMALRHKGQHNARIREYSIQADGLPDKGEPFLWEPDRFGAFVATRFA